MEKKKPIGFDSGRLFCFFTAVVFAVFCAGYLERELWFDEVLTLQFALLPSPAEIYQSYTIPNNQIIHTCFIHALFNLGIPAESMRLFPLFCGAAMVLLLWKNFSRQLGRIQLVSALTALVISPVFLLYATALRGYMLAALFCTMALCAGKKYALSGRKLFLLLWGVFAALAVGVMPSALAGIAAAGLYVIPYCGKKYWKNHRIYLLAAAALAGFALFYIPIWSKLLKAFELKEGWHTPWYALAALAVALAAVCFVPLAAGAVFHRPRLRDLPRTAVWLLPLGSLLLPVSPFPRVWFVILPVLTLLAAGYLRRVPGKLLKILPVLALIWGIFTCSGWFRETVSPVVSLGGQDDFFAPRFVRDSFTPSATAERVCRDFASVPGIFISFDADPFAANYALVTSAFKRQIILPPVVIDVPPGRTPGLPERSLCIIADGEDPAAYEKRFNGNLQELFRNKLHKVYLFRRK